MYRSSSSKFSALSKEKRQMEHGNIVSYSIFHQISMWDSNTHILLGRLSTTCPTNHYFYGWSMEPKSTSLIFIDLLKPKKDKFNISSVWQPLRYLKTSIMSLLNLLFSRLNIFSFFSKFFYDDLWFHFYLINLIWRFQAY